MLFSVIVPVYKVEPYLRGCVDSILAQAFPDFELILVDDGSPDGCPGICDAYAAQDRRVQVLHKPNGGLVSARQAGIQRARGEFVVNVDGDDALAPGMLKRAAALIRQEDPDVVSFAITYTGAGPDVTQSEPLPEGLYGRARKEWELYPLLLMAPDMRHMFWYLCGKAIRRSLLFPCQMAVDPRISLGEDVACLMPVYQRAERVCLSGEAGYRCLVRPGSDSRAFRLVQFEQMLLVLQSLEKLDFGPGWQEQVDRYSSFLCFVMMDSVPAFGPGRFPDAAFDYLKRPELQTRLRRARFSGVTPKTRLAYWLMRRGWYRAAGALLHVCRRLKGRG